MADLRVHHIRWADPSEPAGVAALRQDLQGDLDAICDFIAAESKEAASQVTTHATRLLRVVCGSILTQCLWVQGQVPRTLLSCSRGDARSHAAAAAYLVKRHSWTVAQV